jgi:hypothetical protein
MSSAFLTVIAQEEIPFKKRNSDALNLPVSVAGTTILTKRT